MDDTTLRRREFLARAAAAAGLAGLTSLPGGTLIAEAARAQATALPSPRNLPLDHVVIVMMENRSFDHYFGWLETLGNQWETIFDRAIGRGVSARYYHSDLSFSAVWGPRGVAWTRPLADYYADCALGTLPNVAIVDPPFRDGGGGDGLSADEHPHGDVRLGQAWMADVVTAFVQSSCYRRGALFVVYDEWGGFFDHVRPPRVPDARASGDLDEDFGQMGFRIPAVAVSPFGLGNLTVRDRYATNVGETFDWERPQLEPPDLPDPEHVASRPCALGGGDVLTQESVEAHAGDLAELEALAERFGFPTGSGSVDELFTKPDAIRRSSNFHR